MNAEQGSTRWENNNGRSIPEQGSLLERRGFGRGWAAMLGIALLYGAAVGLQDHTAPLFVIPVTAEFSIYRAQLQQIRSLAAVAGLAALPIWGELFHRRRMKPLLVLACLMAGGCAIAASFTATAQQYALALAVRDLFLSALRVLPLAVIVCNWVERPRALALALAMSGAGLFAAAAMPLLNETLASAGWRAAQRQSGLFFLAAALPCTLLLIRERPEEIGSTRVGGTPAGDTRFGITRRQLPRSKTFWCFVLGAIALSAGLQNTRAAWWLYLMGVEGSRAAASGLSSGYTFMPGVLLLALAFDRWGVRRGLMLSGGLLLSGGALAAGIALVQARGGTTLAVCCGALLGAGKGIPVLSLSYLTAELFGRREHARVLGVYAALTGVAQLANNAVSFSGMSDVRPAMLASAALIAVGLPLLLAAAKAAPGEIARFTEEDAGEFA